MIAGSAERITTASPRPLSTLERSQRSVKALCLDCRLGHVLLRLRRAPLDVSGGDANSESK